MIHRIWMRVHIFLCHFWFACQLSKFTEVHILCQSVHDWKSGIHHYRFVFWLIIESHTHSSKTMSKRRRDSREFFILVGGLEHFYFPIHWECHPPNWRTHMFQRGGASTTNQHFFARKLKHIWWATMRCPRNPWIWSVSSTCRWVIWITRCHVGRQRKPNFNGWIELGYNITAGMPFTLIHSVPI